VFFLKGKGKHYVVDDKLSDYESYKGMHAVIALKLGGASEHDYALFWFMGRSKIGETHIIPSSITQRSE
jgi:hypothetical protein